MGHGRWIWRIVAAASVALLLALSGGAVAQEPPRTADMPIFIYHVIKPGPPPATSMGRLLTVTPDDFEQQLKYLKDNGYHSVSFDDLADWLEHGKALPARPAILSFDDGWDTQFTYALPLLQKYGFTATFFVVTDFLDHQNFLTTDQLKALLAAGMTIGSHTRSHPALPTIGDKTQLWNQIAGSKMWLEQQLGVTIDTFAYPYGAYSPAIVSTVKAAGYRTARTVNSSTHYTVEDLETLAGVLFPVYISQYRAKVELAASGAP